jgi:hypothetical protein
VDDKTLKLDFLFSHFTITFSLLRRKQKEGFAEYLIRFALILIFLDAKQRGEQEIYNVDMVAKTAKSCSPELAGI